MRFKRDPLSSAGAGAGVKEWHIRHYVRSRSETRGERGVCRIFRRARSIFNIDGLSAPSEATNYAPRPERLSTREEAIKAVLHYPAGLNAAKTLPT
jgi:hypothetical protein